MRANPYNVLPPGRRVMNHQALDKRIWLGALCVGATYALTYGLLSWTARLIPGQLIGIDARPLAIAFFAVLATASKTAPALIFRRMPVASFVIAGTVLAGLDLTSALRLWPSDGFGAAVLLIVGATARAGFTILSVLALAVAARRGLGCTALVATGLLVWEVLISVVGRFAGSGLTIIQSIGATLLVYAPFFLTAYYALNRRRYLAGSD